MNWSTPQIWSKIWVNRSLIALTARFSWSRRQWMRPNISRSGNRGGIWGWSDELVFLIQSTKCAPKAFGRNSSNLLCTLAATSGWQLLNTVWLCHLTAENQKCCLAPGGEDTTYLLCDKPVLWYGSLAQLAFTLRSWYCKDSASLEGPFFFAVPLLPPSFEQCNVVAYEAKLLRSVNRLKSGMDLLKEARRADALWQRTVRVLCTLTLYNKRSSFPILSCGATSATALYKMRNLASGNVLVV